MMNNRAYIIDHREQRQRRAKGDAAQKIDIREGGIENSVQRIERDI